MEDNVGGVGGNVKVRNIHESIATSLQAIEYLQTISVGRVVTSYLEYIVSYRGLLELSEECSLTTWRMGRRPRFRW
jgi:hypothetical protein